MFRNFDLPGRSAVHASECAVATSHPLATESALAILREGGNAVDAALAASATHCVVEPQSTGIGGDCFAIVAEPNGTLHGLNGSGRSAANLSLDWYQQNGFREIPETSPHSVTVPGAVKGWETLHERFGRTDFVRLFADAIRYAEDGFPVAPRVAFDWKNCADKLLQRDSTAQIMMKEGASPETGDVWRFPAMGETLRRIATEGAAGFYEGEVAADIANTVQSSGGFLTEDDIGKVTADWVAPVSTEYRGYLLHELPPNGQGIAALMLVGMLGQAGVPASAASIERAHLEIECGRIAYAARDAYIADPEFMEHSVEQLISKEHVTALLREYDPAARNQKIRLPEPDGGNTICLSVVDRDGMAVSFINSLFDKFGSGIVAEKSGFLLQNRGCGFNLVSGHANAIGPGKRPFHTIIPAMATRNGQVTHSFGVMGGSYQSLGHAHVLSNMLDYGMDPQQALDDPRIFWNDHGVLQLERGVPVEVEHGLTKLGHQCIRQGIHGGGQIIHINHHSGMLVAGSDPRKDGHAAGF